MEKSRIMGSSGVEKPSKIINSMFTINPHPQVLHSCVFLTFLGMVIPPLHWMGCASARPPLLGRNLQPTTALALLCSPALAQEQEQLQPLAQHPPPSPWHDIPLCHQGGASPGTVSREVFVWQFQLQAGGAAEDAKMEQHPLGMGSILILTALLPDQEGDNTHIPEG